MMVGSQVQAHVAASWTLPVPQVVGHSQVQVAVLSDFGLLQLGTQALPQGVKPVLQATWH